MKIDDRSREEKLIHLLNHFNDNYNSNITLYKSSSKTIGRDRILSGLSHAHTLRGIKAYFVDRDANILRKEFYKATILGQRSHWAGYSKNLGGMISDIRVFAVALLSDSPECIQWIANEPILQKDNPKHWDFSLHMIQLLLKNDYDHLEEKISIASKKGRKNSRELYANGSDFFSLVMQKNKTALETVIRKSSRKIQDASLREFISPDGVVYAKLCWMNGIEVEVDHPLIPMGLMSVAPLDHYEIDYDFLAPGWEPPEPTFLEKIKVFWRR